MNFILLDNPRTHRDLHRATIMERRTDRKIDGNARNPITAMLQFSCTVCAKKSWNRIKPFETEVNRYLGVGLKWFRERLGDFKWQNLALILDPLIFGKSTEWPVAEAVEDILRVYRWISDWNESTLIHWNGINDHASMEAANRTFHTFAVTGFVLSKQDFAISTSTLSASAQPPSSVRSTTV